MIINPLSIDEELYEFTKKSIIRGYSRHQVPITMINQIVNALKHGNLMPIKKNVSQIVQNPVFKEARKKYESNHVRHKTIWQYIKHEIKDNVSVLDVGCGRGDMGLVILQNRKIKKYIGSDIYLPRIVKNSMPKNEKVEFIRQKSETLIPIPNSSIDVTLMVDMLHHTNMKNQIGLLKHIKSKLKPHGAIIVLEYTFSEREKPLLKNKASQEFHKLTLLEKLEYLTVMDWISNILVLHRKICMPYAFRTYEEWQKLFIELGYEITDSTYIGFPEEFFHQGPYCLYSLRNIRKKS